MSTFRKLRTRRQRAHVSQHSTSHKRDKLDGEARQADRWLLIPADMVVDVKRDFTKVVPLMREFIGVGEAQRPVTTQEFLTQLELHGKGARYVASKRRHGKVGSSQRTCKNPLFEIDVTFPPWASDMLSVGASSVSERVASLLEQLGSAVAQKVQDEIPGTVVCWTVHADTDDPHVCVTCSKIVRDPSGAPRLGIVRGLGLAGPWSVGIDRQQRAGIRFAPHDQRQNALMAKLRQRGVEVPLDIKLARFLDDRCAELLPLNPWVERYRRRIERTRSRTIAEMRASLAAKIDRLESIERAMILEQPEIPRRNYAQQSVKTVVNAPVLERDRPLLD